MHQTISTDQLLQKFIHFLYEIGIIVEFRKLSKECFLPGLYIEDGKLIIDREGLQCPGDILHEAGHIAVVAPADRSMLSNATIVTSRQREAEEMMAIAWSYAAARHLQIDPHIVFHDEGYNGGGSGIVEEFNAGRCLGTPLLESLGMTRVGDSSTMAHEEVYPVMKKWIRGC